MRITPLDIQQKRFGVTAWRGFDKAEVDAFLNLVAAEFEATNRELHDLREEQARQKRMLDEYRSREAAIKETMITAQRVTEEITETAKKEADVIVGRAELEAEKLVERAQGRLTELLGDIAEAKRQRSQMISEIRGILVTHQRLLDIADEAERRPKLEENLAVIRRAERLDKRDDKRDDDDALPSIGEPRANVR